MELNGQKMTVRQITKNNPWTLETTTLERVGAVKERLRAFGITDSNDVTTILNVLDNHGLFHEVTTPEPGDTGKEIFRRAKRMAKDFGKHIINIRKGKILASTSKEAKLANYWPQIGAHQMELEKLEVLSETFQINRGGRIIARLSGPGNRTGSLRGPRSEPEITHALQILDRFLKENLKMEPGERLACLADILRKAMDWQYQGNREEVIDEMKEQVRWRLREGKRRSPLSNVDYYEAIGVSFIYNEDRQKEFFNCMAALNSLQKSDQQKIQSEANLEKLFTLK